MHQDWLNILYLVFSALLHFESNLTSAVEDIEISLGPATSKELLRFKSNGTVIVVNSRQDEWIETSIIKSTQTNTFLKTMVK